MSRIAERSEVYGRVAGKAEPGAVAGVAIIGARLANFGGVILDGPGGTPRVAERVSPEIKASKAVDARDIGLTVETSTWAGGTNSGGVFIVTDRWYAS